MPKSDYNLNSIGRITKYLRRECFSKGEHFFVYKRSNAIDIIYSRHGLIRLTFERGYSLHISSLRDIIVKQVKSIINIGTFRSLSTDIYCFRCRGFSNLTRYKKGVDYDVYDPILDQFKIPDKLQNYIDAHNPLDGPAYPDDSKYLDVCNGCGQVYWWRRNMPKTP